MKKLTFITLAICGIAVTAAPKVLLAQTSSPQTDKIAQVKAGTLTEARASWWGFNKEDSTEALQNAINSGVSKLIIDNTGSDWIIGAPIQLVSHQQIILEDGVVLQAKKGAFKGKNDSLIHGEKVSDVTLMGQGNATLRMQRADYDNPKLYDKAEWRMGIRLMECSDVTLRGLTVEKSGGDGLYLGASANGYNKNILVEDCHFDDNYRLGVGVISVDGLTMRRTTFNNTLGTNPNSGIDFEPNHAGQRLANIVLEDCEFKGSTKGDGLHFYVANLTGDSHPVSITIKRSQISGNRRGMLSTFVRGENLDNPVQGTVVLEDCHFDHNNIQLRETAHNGVRYIFKNCSVDYSGKEGRNAAPILFHAMNADSRAIKLGNVEFDNMSVIPGQNDRVLLVQAQRGVTIADNISGTILRNQQPFDVAAFVREQQQRMDKINALKVAHIDLSQLQVPTQDAAREGNELFFAQGAFTFLQYAEKGQQITVNFRVRKSYNRDTVVQLIAPDGTELESYKLPLDNTVFPVTFTAEQTGLYRLVRKSTFSQRVEVNSSHRGNGFLMDEPMRFLPTKGKLYFEVPAGVKEFSISVSGDSPADVALRDAQGNIVEQYNDITALEMFTGKREDASRSEIWSLDVLKAVWVVSVTLYDPLIPVASTNPQTMLRVE